MVEKPVLGQVRKEKVTVTKPVSAMVRRLSERSNASKEAKEYE
jgi:hypothetical protein